jgi:hypothetical protein
MRPSFSGWPGDSTETGLNGPVPEGADKAAISGVIGGQNECGLQAELAPANPV